MTRRAIAHAQSADRLAAAAYVGGPGAVAETLRLVATGRLVVADAAPPDVTSLRDTLEAELPDSLLNRRGVAVAQAYAVARFLGTPAGQALAREAAPDDESSSNDAGAGTNNVAPAQQKEN